MSTPTPDIQHSQHQLTPLAEAQALNRPHLEGLETACKALAAGGQILLELPYAPFWQLTWLVALAARPPVEGEQILVVVPTQRRQRELLERDIPLLNCFTDPPFSCSALPSIQDFLCRDLLEQQQLLIQPLAAQADSDLAIPAVPLPEAESSPASPGVEAPKGRRAKAGSTLTPGERALLERIVALANDQASGEIAHLPLEVQALARRMVAVDRTSCLEHLCPSFDRCFYRHSAAQAAKANILVAQAETLLGHLAAWHRAQSDWLVPTLQTLVIEDADLLPDLARARLGFTFSLDGLRPLLASQTGQDPRRGTNRLYRRATTLLHRLGQYALSDRYQVRLRESRPVPYLELLDALEAYADALSRTPGQTPAILRMRGMARQLQDMAGSLEEALSLTRSDHIVTLEPDASGLSVLKVTPGRVDKLLAPLFSQPSTVLLVSETLTVAGQPDFLQGELGGLEAAQTHLLPRHQDAEPRLWLVVPESMPDVVEETWAEAVVSRFMELLRRVDGLTVGSFTSDRVLELLQKRARFLGIRGPAEHLGFSESVEVFAQPGPQTEEDDAGPAHAAAHPDARYHSLRCLVIDRLPFPAADDPVLDWAKDRDPGWFTRFALPRAILAFRRTLGLLLRSKAPRAALVVLDRRILTRPYGRAFYDALPGLTICRRLDDVPRILANKEGRG